LWFFLVSLALFLLLIPVIFDLAPAVAFAKLGLDPFLGYDFLILCLLGGSINIPLSPEEVPSHESVDDLWPLFHTYLGIRLAVIMERIIAINFGGAILLGLLCLYLVPAVPVTQTILATVVTTVAAYLLSRPIKGIGIIMPAFVPPGIAAITALIIVYIYMPDF
jgi:uncharacterized membrane protein